MPVLRDEIKKITDGKGLKSRLEQGLDAKGLKLFAMFDASSKGARGAICSGPRRTRVTDNTENVKSVVLAS